MRKLIAFAMLASGALFAQDVTGTWQGTLALPNGTELRTVIKIAKTDAGLRGTFYSIDQSGQGLPTGLITVLGGVLKFAIPGIGGSYEGKLDSDGVTATGNFTQGPQPVPLNLKHVKNEVAWEIPKPPPPPKQLKADNPSFEVATIKPSRPDDQRKVITLRGRDLLTINSSLTELIVFAYGLTPRQVVGGPAWMESDHYDIEGKPEGDGQPNLPQMRIMVKKLLADRFQLKFHEDKKEMSAFALTLGKTGAKLTASAATDANPGLGFRGLGDMLVRNATMKDFTETLQGYVFDRPVVDQTGLNGRFDFTLKWTPDDTQFGGQGGRGAQPDKADAPPDLFTAIQDQLGLKLTSTKIPVDVLVIDKAEKPSAN